MIKALNIVKGLFCRKLRVQVNYNLCLLVFVALLSDGVLVFVPGVLIVLVGSTGLSVVPAV